VPSAESPRSPGWPLPLISAGDPVEEAQAHAAVQQRMFGRELGPVRLGRYVLHDSLGRGGGGTVYAAYDPDLHREVAVKIVGTRVRDHGARAPARLLREAKVLASLSHENVIAVHDVGVVPDGLPGLDADRVFIVMALADGQNLERWLQARRRRWSEVLPVLLAVGRGLAAAHAIGVVHRDVKPSNVLVGRDGRVRVLDFGLACAATEDAPDPDAETHTLAWLSREQTTDGTVAGTPPFMAPEQHAGHAADARSDQFSFCAMAWRALYDRHPFPQGEMDALRDAKQHGPPPVPRASVPGWLGAALRRGLSPDPDDRFESLAALLAAIDVRDRRRKRTQRAAVLGSVLAGTGLLALALQDTGPRCDDAQERLARVWNESVRVEGRAAFADVPVSYADDAWRSVADHVDAFARRWTEEYAQTCTAESPEEFSARTLCLGRQLHSVADLAQILHTADADLVRTSAATARVLPDPKECREPTAMMRELHLDPEQRARVDALAGEHRRALMLRSAGRFDEALAAADALADRASEGDELLYVARAKRLRCDVRLSTRRYADAEAACLEALQTAELAGDGEGAAFAQILLGKVIYESGKEGAEGLFQAARARLAALPASRRRTENDANLEGAWAMYLRSRDDYEGARVALERALRILRAEVAPDDPVLLGPENHLAIVLADLSRLDEAREHYVTALSIAEAVHGPRHPTVAMLQNNLGALLWQLGRNEEALPLVEQARAIKEDAVGADSPMMAATYLTLSRIQVELGRLDEGIATAERLLGLQLTESGGSSAAAVAVIGQARRRQGRCDEVLPALRDASATAERVGGSAAPLALGQCLVALERLDEARVALRLALELERDAFGDGHRGAVRPLVALAPLIDPEEGRALLQRARAIVETTEGDPADADRIASARVTIARRERTANDSSRPGHGR
jgi:tetratricopeptide (TPR) repeat protein